MDKKNIDDFANSVTDKTNYILEDTLLDAEAKNESTKSFNYSDLIKNSPKAKMSKLLWLISIFLILIIALYLVFIFLNSNPQTIFTNTIDKFFSSITDNISDNNYDISKGKIKYIANINDNSNVELFNEISKINLDIDYTIDNANDLIKLKIFSKYDNDNLIDLDIYTDKNNLYIYSDDIYEKYLKIKNDSKIKFINPKDIKIILNGLNQAFDKVATSEKIYGEKTNLDLGNKTIKVSQTKLIIDKTNYIKISDTFVNSLKSNVEFVSSLAKLRGTSNKDIQKSLEKLSSKLKTFFANNEVLEVKLYNDRKTKEFIKGVMNGKLGSFTLSKNKNDYSFVLVNNKNNQNVSGNFIIDVNDKKTVYNIEFNFKNEINGNLENSSNFKLNFTNNKAKSFKRINTSNAKDINELTELEKFGIYTKLFSNPNLNKFIKFIK